MVARWREAIKAAADEARELLSEAKAEGIDFHFPTRNQVVAWAKDGNKTFTIGVTVRKPKPKQKG